MSLFELLEGHKKTAAEQVAESLKVASNGGKVDLAKLERALPLTGRTMEDFAAELRHIERRAEVPAKRQRLVEMKAQSTKASLALHTALSDIDDMQKKAEKLVADAMAVMCEKSDISGSLSRQVSQLEAEIHEDLMATCDPALQVEIDRLESQARVLTEQHCNGRQRFFDPSQYHDQNEMVRARDSNAAEIVKGNEAHNSEIESIQNRMAELRAAQVAV